MEESSIVEEPAYPFHISNLAIPNDAALKRAYNVYKPSKQTLQLRSERGRTIYPEVFIENSNLGTLGDLCVRVLARSYGPQPHPIIASNPLLLTIHYDALDVDLPLAKCVEITEERFWKRLVLAKHRDKTLALKPNINWKNLGVSLKFVELVEACPAEYWPEEEMTALALKVKEFVSEMHIKRLQSLSKRSFEKYFESETESTSQESDNGEDSESLIETSSEEEIVGLEADKTVSQLELEKEIAIRKAQRKEERQNSREAKLKAREAKEAKRKRRQARRGYRAKPEKKPLQDIPDNIFDIVISESEDDGEEHIIDKRNKALLLQHIKKYKYPAKDCHHIDLKFVQYFTNLEIFTIEFLGPIQNRNYHNRHLNFSYDDIEHLASGLSHLPKLKVFRLRNSRMDAEKLQILCRALGLLPNLETLDFGFDQLKDDCGSVFKELFQTTESLKNLELESNCLGEQVLSEIGNALKGYNANKLVYLGLARNPITDEALHALISAVIGTNHIEELNIKAVQFVTDKGLCCCLANELLKQHPALIKLDICALPISPLAANEIMKSIDKNEQILELNCCCCELDEETEVDIKVILKRNKYISENYYLKDPSATKEDITKHLNRTRNPILLKVLAERENYKQCLQNLTVDDKPLSNLNSPAVSRAASLDIKPEMYEPENSSLEMETSAERPQRFVYPANEFDEQQFLDHVYQPGPQERYYYFKMYKQKYLIQDKVKNKSLI